MEKSMKRFALAGALVAFAFSQAVAQDKPLAGAAKASFMKKCESDA
jgi:hypothetical protein